MKRRASRVGPASIASRAASIWARMPSTVSPRKKTPDASPRPLARPSDSVTTMMSDVSKTWPAIRNG
jgi:hypothetical protein